MQELINSNVFKVNDTVILHKFPQAAGKIIKVNKTTISVLLSSVDQEVDARIFNVKPSDIYQHWKISR